MPYQQFERSRQGDFMMQGALAVSEGIQRKLKEIEDAKKQEAFATPIMEKLASETGPDGKPYVSIEDLAKYHKANNSTKAQISQAAMANADFDDKRAVMKQRMSLERAKMVEMILQKNQEGMAVPLKAADGAALPGQYYVPGAKRIINTKEKGKNADSWKKLDADVQAVSGAKLGDWNGAQNKRIEGDFFVADAPGGEVPPGTPPELAATLGAGKKKKLQVPLGQYKEFMSRYKELAGGDPFGETAAPRTETGGAAATQKVRVKSPDGKTGFIPANQLEDALAAGYSQI